VGAFFFLVAHFCMACLRCMARVLESDFANFGLARVGGAWRAPGRKFSLKILPWRTAGCLGALFSRVWSIFCSD